MLRGILTGAIVMMALTAGLPAFAAPGSKGDKSTTYDFDGDTIETEYMKPDQMMIEGLKKKGNEGFIKIRTDFVKEIVRSAEDL